MPIMAAIPDEERQLMCKEAEQTYSPWLNPIERLWPSSHETITRNHQCRYMWQLWKQVTQFINVVSPFPVNQPRVAKVER